MPASIATLLISKQEELPRSVMESLALETSVTGTNIRRTRGLLKDGLVLLIEVGDVKELTRTMTWMVGHSALACLMGKQGREHMV